MHPNEQLLTNLFQYLNAHNASGMAACYREDAMFQDIAFRLRNKEQIHAMWDMICSPNKDGVPSDIKATVQEMTANDSTGRAVVVEDYTYRDNGRKVHNKITSKFEFRDGFIVRQEDNCDPLAWANQAFGGIKGLIAGHVELARRWKAMSKLKAERPQAFQN
jgi:ketosteroid isomerase-like protein